MDILTNIMGYTEGFFSYNRYIMALSGLWPIPTKNKLYAFLLLRLHSFLVMSSVLYFCTAEWLSLSSSYENRYDLSKNLTIAIAHSVGAIKELFMIYYRNIFEDFMAVMEDKKFHYDGCVQPNFDPGDLSRRYKRRGEFWIKLFMVLTFATSISSTVPLAVFMLIKYLKGEEYQEQKLPYCMWTPFTVDSHLKYVAGVAYQAYPIYYHAIGIVAVDTLYSNLMNCIALNFVLINGAFLTIRERSFSKLTRRDMNDNELQSVESLNLIMKEEFKKICKHLQAMYKVCENIEKLNKYVILLQTTTGIFVLCASLYLVSSTPLGDTKIYGEITYIAAVLCQIMLYCWFGNELTQKHAKITTALFDSDWLAADKSFKKIMLFTMTRSNVPVYLTTGGFAPLTLGTFMQILKGSYSFYALMKNTQK